MSVSSRTDPTAQVVDPEAGIRKPRKGFFRQSPIGAAGVALFGVLIVLAVFAPWISGQDPLTAVPSERLLAPSPEHPFGTDDLGRDVFSRVLHGGRASLAVGALIVLLAVGGGALIGLLAGYFRWVDAIIMRFVDGLMSFPGLVLAIALIGVLGTGIVPVVIALTLVYAPRVTRIVRGSALTLKGHPMVEAAKQVGASNLYVIFRHVAPHCLSPIIVQGSFIFAYAVLGEAALSFLGVGVPPSIPTWGNVLTEARSYLSQAWWMAVFPGIFIILSVLALNLVGDELRDYFDPKLKRRKS